VFGLKLKCLHLLWFDVILVHFENSLVVMVLMFLTISNFSWTWLEKPDPFALSINFNMQSCQLNIELKCTPHKTNFKGNWGSRPTPMVKPWLKLTKLLKTTNLSSLNIISFLLW
jgi:hypothetical protein